MVESSTGLSFFGEEWNMSADPLALENTEINVVTTGFGVVILKNNEIGIIAFSAFPTYFSWNEQNNYKALSLIYEKTASGRPYLICTEDKKSIYAQWNNYNNTICTIEEFLSDFPKNIIEIQQRSLITLYKKYPKYGFQISQAAYYEYFVEDTIELAFVLNTMVDNNLIAVKAILSPDGYFSLGSPLVITQYGWIEIQKIIEHNYSKQVFIAMSFAPEMDSAYTVIRKVISDIGYTPVRIDKKEHNNEISGEILNEIKNSYFIIADVTGQRNGVYFEAGFAMGHNKPVIWCCAKKEEKAIHFDTRQYNHIFWENEQQLYEKLKDRILGTITIKE
jgi:hypothetical protein